MRAHWKLAVLATAACLLGSYACVAAVSLGDSDECLGVAMPPRPNQFGATAKLPAPAFRSFDSPGLTPGKPVAWPAPAIIVKPDRAGAGRGPVTFQLIPTTWDVEFMLIPTQWDVKIFLVSEEHGATRSEVAVPSSTPTAPPVPPSVGLSGRSHHGEQP